jgi:DNA-binding CsgD family transcriptional regulator
LIGLAAGYTRAEIADALEVSVSTVNNRIYEAQRRNKITTSYQLLARYVHDVHEEADRLSDT